MYAFLRRMSVLAVALTAIAGVANAAPVSVSDLQNQTVNGQNFNFNFGGLAASDNTGGTLVLHAQGDFDGLVDEALSWTAESLIGSAAVGGFIGGAGGVGGPFDFVTVFQPLGNVEFQRTYALSNIVLNALLADNMISIFVDLFADVGLFNPPNFVEFTINYNSGSVVPLPAALPLFGTGLAAMGLLGWRRKRKAQMA